MTSGALARTLERRAAFDGGGREQPGHFGALTARAFDVAWAAATHELLELFVALGAGELENRHGGLLATEAALRKACRR